MYATDVKKKVVFIFTRTVELSQILSFQESFQERFNSDFLSHSGWNFSNLSINSKHVFHKSINFMFNVYLFIGVRKYFFFAFKQFYLYFRWNFIAAFISSLQWIFSSLKNPIKLLLFMTFKWVFVVYVFRIHKFSRFPRSFAPCVALTEKKIPPKLIFELRENSRIGMLPWSSKDKLNICFNKFKLKYEISRRKTLKLWIILP